MAGPFTGPQGGFNATAAVSQGAAGGGAMATPAQPIFPARGDSVSPIDLNGLGDVAKYGMAAYNNLKNNDADAAKNAALADTANTQTQIRFGAANGASADALATLADGYKSSTGTDLTPAQRQMLQQHQQTVQAIQQAQQQNPRFAADQALLIAQNRAIQSHPDLTKEIMQLSGQMQTNSHDFMDSAFIDVKQRQEQQQQAQLAIQKVVEAHGYDTTQMSPDQIRQVANENVLPGIRAIQTSEDAWKLADTNDKLSNLQKTNAKDQAMAGAQAPLWAMATAGVRTAMEDAKSKGGTPQQIAQAGQDAISQFSINARNKYGITTQSEFDSRLGYITQPLQADVQNFATGKLDTEGLENQNKVRLAVAQDWVMKNVPKADLMAVLSTKFGPLVAGGVKDADGNDLVAEFLKNAASAASGGGPGDPTHGQGNNMPLSTITKQAGQSAAIINRIYTNPDQATPEGKVGAAQTAFGYLTDPSALRSFESVKNIAPAIADPRWLDLSKGVAVPQKALDTVNSYIDSINTRSASLVAKEGANLLPSVDAKGNIHFDVKNPSPNLSKLKTLEADLNEATHMYAHLHGSTDYQSVLKQLVQEQMAKAQ